MANKKTLETFLREKLESEIQVFGDGNTEFHTRDLEQLLDILEEKDEQIRGLKESLSKSKAVKTNQDFMSNVALSYRHDFGLMNETDRTNLLNQCERWITAINNNLNIGKSKKKTPDTYVQENKCYCENNHYAYGFEAGEEYVVERRSFSSFGVLNSKQRTWYNFYEKNNDEYTPSTDFHQFFKLK